MATHIKKILNKHVMPYNEPLYIVIFEEGPIAHSQPAYARVPGIRVYGMTCVRPNNRRGRDFSWDISGKSAKDDPSSK